MTDATAGALSWHIEMAWLLDCSRCANDGTVEWGAGREAFDAAERFAALGWTDDDGPLCPKCSA